jgi:hypothetical protein
MIYRCIQFDAGINNTGPSFPVIHLILRVGFDL